jgi:hypothetical protein
VFAVHAAWIKARADNSIPGPEPFTLDLVGGMLGLTAVWEVANNGPAIAIDPACPGPFAALRIADGVPEDTSGQPTASIGRGTLISGSLDHGRSATGAEAAIRTSSGRIRSAVKCNANRIASDRVANWPRPPAILTRSAVAAGVVTKWFLGGVMVRLSVGLGDLTVSRDQPETDRGTSSRQYGLFVNTSGSLTLLKGPRGPRAAKGRGQRRGKNR